MKCVATSSGATFVVADPASDEVTLSVAVTLWLPAVLSVTVKACCPLDNVEFAGSTAAESLLLNFTVPV